MALPRIAKTRKLNRAGQEDVASFRRDVLRLAASLALIFLIVWSPYLFAGKTLLSSSSDVPSIYTTGAGGADPTRRVSRSLDAGAPGWLSEPGLALLHRLVFDEHVLPMWNPYAGYGVPFAASMQQAPFHPLTFGAAIHPAPWTYNLYVLARLFVVAFGCALFVRLFAGFAPALIAGICAAFSGYFVLYLDMGHIAVEAMLPWSLSCVELIARRASPLAAAWLAAAWTLTLLGGMPESAALAGVVVLSYAVFRTIASRREGRVVPRLAMVAVGLVVGTLIAGIMLVPFVEYVGRDFDVHQASNVGQITGLGFEPFSSRVLLTEFAPLASGPPWNNIHTGFTGDSGVRGAPGTFAIFFSTVAACAAIVWFRRRAMVDRVALFMAAVVLVLEAKRFGFLLNGIGSLPVLRLIVFEKYGEAAIAVLCACLAGLGAAAVLERRAPARVVMLASVVVLGSITGLYQGAIVPESTRHAAYFYDAVTLALVVLAAAGSAAFYAQRNSSRRIVSVIFVALAAIEGTCAFVVPVYYVVDKPASAERNPYVGAPYVRYLREATARDQGRISANDGELFPDWAGAFGLYDTRDLDAMYPRRYLSFISAFLFPTVRFDDGFDRFTGQGLVTLDAPLLRRWLVLSSIQYWVSAKAGPAAQTAFRTAPGLTQIQGLHRLENIADVSVYRVDGVLPRLALLHRVEHAADGNDALRAITGPGFDVASTAVVEGDVPHVSGDDREDRVRLISRGPQRIEADVTATSDALLLQNDTWYPGWSASVDGRDSQIYVTDYLFRGIAVPAGRHRVVIAYRSRAVGLGLALSAFGIILLAGLVVAERWYRRRPVPVLAAIPLSNA